MIKVFNYFHISALLNLQKAILQFIKENLLSSLSAEQNWMSKTPSFCYCTRRANASKFSILISTNSEIETYQKRMMNALPISGSFLTCPGNCYI